ncbi:hypothetical protein VTO73DRAFT_10972 [Trametes versicolor]
MDYSDVASLDSQSLEQFARSLGLTSTLEAALGPELDIYPYNQPSTFSVDEFDCDVDRAGLDDAPGLIDPALPLADVYDVEWTTWFDLPQSPLQAPSSVYSDDSNSTTIPASPASMASDATAVDPNHNFFPKCAAIEDFACNGQHSNPPATEPYGYPMGAFGQGPLPVTYSVPSGLMPPIESDPWAFSSRCDMGADTYVRPQQQQHLSGAAASAWCGMSMPAGDYVAPLTSQHIVDVPETCPEVVPGSATSSTATASSKRASSVDGEKPAKKRKRQSTEKNLVCPECGSLWARRNNLDTHISSVHKQKRPFVCLAPGCTRAFSRKHDLKRHFQSDHTDQGSPRRKAPKA